MIGVLPQCKESPANVAAVLGNLAAAQPQMCALIEPRRRLFSSENSFREKTFLELEEMSRLYACALEQRGITKDTRTLLMVPPGADYLALWFALLKLGAVVILIDPGMGRDNLYTCIQEVEPEALIAVPLVYYLSRFKRKVFASIQISVVIGRTWAAKRSALAPSLSGSKSGKASPTAMSGGDVLEEDPAAIVFTTGATGVPKGVVYTHRIIRAQIELLQSTWNIRNGEVGLAAFLPFSLFCVAMGTTCVIPRVNPRRPAGVQPQHVLDIIRRFNVTYSFGSPAFWGKVACHAAAEGESVESLKKVIMFGAPVREDVLRNLQALLPPGGDSATPYGATEAMPVCSIPGREILRDTLAHTQEGAGVCVGKPLAGLNVKVIHICEEEIKTITQAEFLPSGEIGEIVVSGAIVSAEYANRPAATLLAKMYDGGIVWHRMGDLGYFDEYGRLWFCGRKNHRVVTERETLFTVTSEAIFNRHPAVSRSALVGLGLRGTQRPVICIELKRSAMKDPKTDNLPLDGRALTEELLQLGAKYRHTKLIRTVLFHPSFPVDYRHNAKILREKLSAWAEARLR